MQTEKAPRNFVSEPGAPLVSILVPIRNEEKWIGRVLRSLLSQDFQQPIEILVIDGESTDCTCHAVSAIRDEHRNVRLLQNQRRLPSFGLNLGVQEARGEYVIRADAHTLYARSYVRKCVELLRRGDAAAVGGVQRATGLTYRGRAIAAALSCGFGVGNARFRYTKREIYSETVYLGAWRRNTLREIGQFAEVNEDGEMGHRLRRAGLRILVSPEIKLRYLARHSLSRLARQYAWYGRARMQTLVRYPDALQVRQLVPLTLLFTLLLSAIIFPLKHALGLIVPGTYLAVDLLGSAHLAHQRGLKYLPAFFVIFPTMHISWALGACAGMARFGVPWASLRSLWRSAGAHRRFVRAKADSA